MSMIGNACRKSVAPAAIAAAALAFLVHATGHAAAADRDARNDLREFRVGMMVAELPGQGYVDLVCAGDPARTLRGWSEHATCPADEQGRHGVRFRFDDATNPRVVFGDKYEGTKVAGHPVLLTLLIGDDERVEGLVIETDPAARLYLRKKAFLLANQVKARYGEDGWVCRSDPPAANEVAVGGVLIKEHCEKEADGRRLVLDRRLLRPAGEELKAFVGSTRLVVLLAE